MDDVNFIFQCECGETRFLLRKDGEVECPECRNVFTDLRVTFDAGPRLVRQVPDKGGAH